MQLKRFSYFTSTFHASKYFEAAAAYGISPSTLSESITSLEKEFGLPLIQRGPHKRAPTDAANWLHQRIEPVLQLAELAEAILDHEDLPPIECLTVTSPLPLASGCLSRATRLAVQALRKEHPNVIVEMRFHCGTMTPPDAVPQSAPSTTGDIVLDYGDGANGGDLVLFHDEWAAVMSSDRRAGPKGRIDLDGLRRLRLVIPPLPVAQTSRIRAYCSRHDLADPGIMDVETFARQTGEATATALLTPRALIAGVLGGGADFTILPEDMSSPIIARSSEGVMARRYLALLWQHIEAPGTPAIRKPRLTLRQMRYFLMLYDQPSMAAAARALHIVQPALSSQLRKLEATLGKLLFHRRSSGLEPTHHAHRFAQVVRLAVGRCDQLTFQAAHMAAAQHQRLSIGIVPLINHTGPLVDALSETVKEWTRSHPLVSLKILEAPAGTLYRWVESGAVSMALVETHLSHSSQLDLHSQDVLGIVSHRSAAAPPHGPISLAQAVSLPLILPNETFGLRQMVERAASKRGLRVTPRMEVGSFAMTLALVRDMQFATILPETAIRPHVSDGTFTFNPIADPVIRRRLSIMFSTDRSLTEIEHGLIHALRRHLARAGFGPLTESAEDSDAFDQLSA